MVRRKSNRKWIVGGVFLILLIIIGTVIGIIINNNQNTGDGNENEAEDSAEVVELEDTEKKEGETEEEYSERLAEEKRVKQYEGEDPNKAEELSGAITYAGVNNGMLMVGMNIDQYLGGGNCELSLMRSENTIYSASAKIIAEVSTSTCDGFSVPVSGLGSGATEIVIKLNADGKTGTIRGEVNL